MNKYREYLVNTEHWILLQKLNPLQAPNKCPNVLTYTTQYTNLYLTLEDPTGFPHITSDLNFSDFVCSRDDYLAYYVEQQLLGQDQQLQKSICQSSLGLNDNKVIEIKENIMSQRNGDIIETFRCKEKEGQIKEEKECYDAIPINPTGFVKTENRVYTTKAKPIECNIHFPLKIQAKESWIQFTPRIIKIDPPKDFPEEIHSAHLNLTHGGIYKSEELDA